MRKIVIILLVTVISFSIHAQPQFLPSPGFFTVGYQAGYGNYTFTSINRDSYSPTYPFASIDGFLGKKFFYHIDITSFIILGMLMRPGSREFVISNSKNGNQVIDIYSPVYFSTGRIRIWKGFLMPFGFDLTLLGLNSITISGIKAIPSSESPRADIMYLVQYFLPAKSYLLRVQYAIGPSLHGEFKNKLAYRVETSCFIPIDVQLHLLVIAFYQHRDFYDNHSMGIRCGIGYNW